MAKVFSFAITVWRDDVDDMVTEIFEDVPKIFTDNKLQKTIIIWFIKSREIWRQETTSS